MTDFTARVVAVVKAIPEGKVASYGQVAAAAGQPRAARMVGMILARRSQDLPWQRVINRHGMISIENMQVTKDDQAELLRREGVEVKLVEGNWFVGKEWFVEGEELLGKSGKVEG